MMPAEHTNLIGHRSAPSRLPPASGPDVAGMTASGVTWNDYLFKMGYPEQQLVASLRIEKVPKEG